MFGESPQTEVASSIATVSDGPRACSSDANSPAAVGVGAEPQFAGAGTGAGAGAGAARCNQGTSGPPVGAGAGAGAGAAAVPCGIVSLPARHAATNARLVCHDALIAALLAAYSASHWLVVFNGPEAGAWP